MFEADARQAADFSTTKSLRWTRRAIVGGLSMVLAACTVVPKGPVTPAAPPPPPAPPPTANLPTDSDRHRVALLVPQSGVNAAAGQAMANASTMALLDTNAQSLRITTYDTGTGAGAAASGPCSTATA
jgi:hypothetical protein